jgi:hypothetical protein
MTAWGDELPLALGGKPRDGRPRHEPEGGYFPSAGSSFRVYAPVG